MVKASIVAHDLPDYYRQLVAAQEAAHGPGYCSHHQAIRDAVKAGAVSYGELGVNQGATLACALLAGYRSVEGVDIALEPFRASEGLFRGFARAQGRHLTIWQQDSRLPIGEVDFLLIDTVHTMAHLREELAVHGPNVRRFILVHDTTSVPVLHLEAVTWGLRNSWTVAHRETSNVGWTLLRRGA